MLTQRGLVCAGTARSESEEKDHTDRELILELKQQTDMLLENQHRMENLVTSLVTVRGGHVVYHTRTCAGRGRLNCGDGLTGLCRRVGCHSHVAVACAFVTTRNFARRSVTSTFCRPKRLLSEACTTCCAPALADTT